jgi:predicted CxxxxCH...CXXCH cytochrome family protein
MMVVETENKGILITQENRLNVSIFQKRQSEFRKVLKLHRKRRLTVTYHFNYKWFISLLAVMFLASCSGGSDSTVDVLGSGQISSGIAVDPYIENAVFQEIEEGTGLVLQESSPSNEFGIYTFSEPLTPGSLVELKASDKGLHGGAPYQGMLRRLVVADDEQPLVVSPLTTLLANGITPEELIAAFNNAGLTDLTNADLYADPMNGLADMTTGVTVQNLKSLQANMAANAFMEITGNFESGVIEFNDPNYIDIFNSMVNSMVNLLDPVEFETIIDTLSNDPDVTTPLLLQDFIQAVLADQQTIVALTKENIMNSGNFDQALVDQAVLNAQDNAVANVKSWYNQRVPSSTIYDGALLYHDNCAGCHQPLDVTTKAGRTAADIQSAIDNNLGGMGSLSSLTQGEIAAIADALQPVAPAPPDPGTTNPPDGTILYSTNCAGCHGQLDVTSKPGRTAADIQAAIDSNTGNMGFLSTLTPEEVQAIADALPQTASPGAGPDYSDCTLCHGQPPDGNSYPDTAGAHAVHAALASVGGDCSVCHQGAAHNSQVDIGFPSSFDAKSGPATDNLDGTCSSVKCHGGQTTPDWWSGSIVVETQCAACHASGTSQYNSYSSGKHSTHIGKGYSCTVCHNTDKLSNGHFDNLETSAFELSPAATIGGGSTSVGSYSNRTCSNIACHGSRSW